MPAKTMTRPAFVVVSVLGLAAAAPLAHAQMITIDVADPSLIVGESTTITLSASYGAGDYAIAGIATEIIDHTGQGGFSDLALVAPMAGPGSSAGEVVATGVQGIIAGQLNFPPAGIYADPSNPIAFWQMTFTLTHAGGTILDIETRTSRFDVYVDRERSLSESRLGDLVEGRAEIIIPAPGSAAVLGLGVLAIGRRRR